jgi:hypothetical protein
MAGLFISPFAPALALNGSIAPAATLTFYTTGTTTAQNVYADAGLVTSLGSVVTANAQGQFVAIYLAPTPLYRAVLKTSAGTVLGDIDPVTESTLAALSAPSGASLIGTSNNFTVQGNFDSMVSLSTTQAISAASTLTQLNTFVMATATGGDYLATLPPVAVGNLGAQILLSVSNDSVNLVSVTAAPASGLYVGGQSIQYFAPGETVLFVYEGATAGWVMPFVRRVPIVAEMLSSGGALALNAASFTYLPLVKGAQQMNAPYVGWFLTDHFVAPRDGVYTISSDIWISSLTGAPGQIDFGYYVNVAPNALNGNPGTSFFARKSLTNNTYQSISRTFTRRLSRLQYIVPTFQLQGPTAGSIADTAVVISRVTVTESFV